MCLPSPSRRECQTPGGSVAILGHSVRTDRQLVHYPIHLNRFPTEFAELDIELPSARTPKRTSSLKTDVKSPKKERWSCELGKYLLSVIIFIFHSWQRRGHWRGQATTGSLERSISRWPKLASLGSSSQGTQTCWSNREISFLFGWAVFYFFFKACKICSCSSFQNFFLFQKKDLTACAECSEKNFLLRAGRFYTFFFKFSSVKETIRKFAESWRNGLFCLSAKGAILSAKSVSKFSINWINDGYA